MLSLSTQFSLAQDYTIRDLHTDSIFVGPNNLLQINGYYEEIPSAEMTIEKSRERRNLITISSPDVSCQKVGYNQFVLLTTREKQANRIYVTVAGTVVDTIILSSHRVKHHEFFVLKNSQLIKSGTYPLGLIKQIDALKIGINVPWFNIPILGYRITISNGDEILLDERIKGTSLNHPQITKAIARLKKDGRILIARVHAKKPWSCGGGFRFMLEVG